jgi:hypothetical protein
MVHEDFMAHFLNNGHKSHIPGVLRVDRIHLGGDVRIDRPGLAVTLVYQNFRR